MALTKSNMPDPGLSCGDGSSDTLPKQRVLVVSSVFTEDQMAAKLGREAYSYRFVYSAFEPPLRRWSPTVEITRPESRLDYALLRPRQQSLEPIHFRVLPLPLTYVAYAAPNVALRALQ